MIHRHWLIAILMLAVTGRASAAFSALDETQLRLLQQYSIPLRWYNIEGAPQRIAGADIHHPFGQRLHLIHLAPGEDITLRAPADAWLRIAAEARPLNPDDVEVRISSDARAFSAAIFIKTSDPYSMVMPLLRDRSCLVRITRPRHADSKLIFAAFFSHEEPFETLMPYREKVALPGDALKLRRDDEPMSQETWLVKTDGVEFPIEGPARVQLVARLPWPIDEPVREHVLTLQLKLDGTDTFPLQLGPELDSRHRTRVNGETELVSYKMYGYFNVPGGKHSIRVQPTAPVYLSAFRQTEPEFLFPSWNAPKTNLVQAPSTLRFDLGQSAIIFEFPSSLPDAEQSAWRLARDNQPMDAGAQAADWFNRLSQTRRDYPPAQQAAETLWRQRTFYRELLPAHQTGDQPLRAWLFSTVRLRDPFEPRRPFAVFNPTLEQAGDSLVSGNFAAVPDAQNPLTYALPQRSFDSRLRIAALTPGNKPAQVFVQFDQQKPIEISLDAQPALPSEELESSAARPTLRVLEQESQASANRVAGPSVEFDLARPIVEPGVVELPLPATVRQVRIYSGTPETSVLASVAYRAAKQFELGEADFLSALNTWPSNETLQLLSDGGSKPAGTNISEASTLLCNHFLPLSRLLKTHRADFTKSVALPAAPQSATLMPEETAQLKQTALAFENAGQRIEAIDAWNRLFWEGSAADRSEAALAVMRGLQALGEDFLAIQYARYAVLSAPASHAPATATALLETAATRDDDVDQLEQLRGFLFMNCPCPRHLANLVEAFALNSRDEMALSAGLLLPRDQRPVEPMLASALRLNWWRTFDSLLESLPQAGPKAFWRAQRHLAFHRFADAELEFKQAGDRGAEMLRALETGRSIRERLGRSDLNERLDAVFAWEQWQSHLPGAKSWRNAEDVAYQSSASELLFNVEQNQFAQYLRAEPAQPVTLRFVGPLRLQIEARPVLDLPFDQPVDDWLEISEFGITNRVPISQCVPNPSLQFTSGSRALAGVKTATTLDCGPGWHELTVRVAGRSGLIRVLQEQPVLPMRILPTLNATRLNRVLASGGLPISTTPEETIEPENKVWWVPSELAASSNRGIVPEFEAPTNAVLTDLQNTRLALRLNGDRAPAIASGELHRLPADEQWLAVSRWKRWNEFTNWSALPDVNRVNYLLSAGRGREVLESTAPRDPRQRLIALLQVAETSPELRIEAQCLAEALVAETNCPPGGRNILLRLTRDLSWAPLPVSPASAGIRPIRLRSDLPQDPSSRLRRALLRPATTNQFTIASQSAFSAAMTLQHPAQVEVRAEIAKAGFSPLAPLTVALQVDAADVESLSLTPSDPVAVTNFNLAAGPHLVRLWIVDPVVNQFVRLEFAGQSEGGTNSVWSQSLAEASVESRFFHSATATQPIRFSWKGPALLRLDEWRDGRFISQLRRVPAGEQTVEVQPAPGRDESWYRIFVRASETNQTGVRPVWATRQPDEVPAPKLQLPASARPTQADLVDYFRLGGQEDGTLTANLLFARRRPFDIDGQANGIVNEFVEANAVWRKAAAGETTWFFTEALARVHQPGDVTLGLVGAVDRRPLTSRFDWAGSIEAYAGSAGPDQQDIQASLQAEFEIGPRYQLNRRLDYYPYAGAFARYLTLDPADAFAAGYTYIDQDLFTQFKYDHRWGWVVGNQIEYRPWLDARLRGILEMSSNEDFTPDHWGVRCSWSQLFGPFRGEVAYRFTHFLADDDRSSDAFRQGISATLYAECWLSGRHRVELGAQFRHDWPDSGDSYFFVLSWDFSRGRRYKDYGPRETGFRALRNHRIPPAFNNHFQPGPPGATLP